MVEAFTSSTRIENVLLHLSGLLKLSAGNFSLRNINKRVLECDLAIPPNTVQLNRALDLISATLDLLEEQELIRA